MQCVLGILKQFKQFSKLNSVSGKNVFADGICCQGVEVFLAGMGKNLIVQGAGFWGGHRIMTNRRIRR